MIRASCLGRLLIKHLQIHVTIQHVHVPVHINKLMSNICLLVLVIHRLATGSIRPQTVWADITFHGAPQLTPDHYQEWILLKCHIKMCTLDTITCTFPIHTCTYVHSSYCCCIHGYKEMNNTSVTVYICSHLRPRIDICWKCFMHRGCECVYTILCI